MTKPAAYLFGCIALLTGCGSTQPKGSAGIEGVQTIEQRRQAERFVINTALGTKVGNEPLAGPIHIRPASRSVASPPPCDTGPFPLRSLPVAEIRLSNQSVEVAAQVLSVMGYTVLSPKQPESAAPVAYDCQQLPILVLPQAPSDDLLTFSGQGSGAIGEGGTQGFSPLRAGQSQDLDRLLVFYHPEEMERLELLTDTITWDIDKASPQVFLETLVVEVNKEDSKELGVDWESADVARQSVLGLGQLSVGLGSTVDMLRDTRRQGNELGFTPGQGARFRLRALVESGRAQILSRPSVLALSNRQAIIQIVDIIQSPVLASRMDVNGNFTVSDYSFEPLLIGITLSLRPRVSSDRRWVSMEIDATVDAEVDENSGEVFAADGVGDRVLLASKPGLSSRKVRTFARIPDRTPIIIGGLAAASQERRKSRVPFFGSIPFLGALFGATDNEVQEREIMIVLTPYILDEEHVGVGANSYLGATATIQSPEDTVINPVTTPNASNVTMPTRIFEPTQDRRVPLNRGGPVYPQAPQTIESPRTPMYRDGQP